MCSLVREAMKEGALGVSSALGYAPGCFASTEELIELARAAAEFGGVYASHIRSEGSSLLEAVDELILIARAAGVPAEIYHLKASGNRNWDKLDRLIEKVRGANARGLRITADMYPYPALSTGLEAAMPPWVQQGGLEAWVARLQDPEIRERVRKEMTTPSNQWDNAYLAAGSPDKIVLVGFKSEMLKPFTGKTLAEIAVLRGATAEETAMDLVIEDRSGLDAVYFTMSERNLQKQIGLPWVSFGSDSAAPAPEGTFLRSSVHPRAYGTFARLLGRYVREKRVIALEEAVRRLTSFPAATLGLDRRGLLAPGYYADVVAFDPNAIQDLSTFGVPHQYPSGVVHLFVNGEQVLMDGDHTNARPGRVLGGPGDEQRRRGLLGISLGKNRRDDRLARRL
jgi:N-acyl-D-amino-acid deacylase